MDHLAFSAPGQFWRGNLHTHSTLSDGALAPEEVCRRYAQAGYDFMCLSDHLVGQYGYPIADTLPYRTNRFTTILGAEMHVGRLSNGEIWHLLAVGLPADFAPPHAPDFTPRDDSESAAELAARAVAAGAFVAIAHPQWYGLGAADAALITAAHAVEIYNHGCAVECDRADGFAVLDQLLGIGRRLTACATDDAHFHGPDHFGGWVMVKAEANEPEALLVALKAGAYYSSTGPTLTRVGLTDSHVVVECSPAQSVIVVGAASAADAVHGDGLTRAELSLDEFRPGGWLRATVIDAAGKRAWSNPIWLD